jgi:predicted CXXCH cytochrome family protein
MRVWFRYGVALLPLLFAAGYARAEANPHYGAVVCTACHVDEEDYELREEDPTLLCNRCHEGHRRMRDHHPLRTVDQSITLPEDWPLYEGKLTCLTCHVPSHEENIGLHMFLRGDNHKGREKFCFHCHRREALVKINPHVESNEGTGCGLCHDRRPEVGVDTLETVTFCGNPDVLCQRCHTTPPHPASYQHNRLLPQKIIASLTGKQKLYRGERIICSTCHNPHAVETEDFMLRYTIGKNYCPFCHKQ